MKLIMAKMLHFGNSHKPDGRTRGWVDVRMAGWIEGRMGGWVNGWVRVVAALASIYLLVVADHFLTLGGLGVDLRHALHSVALALLRVLFDVVLLELGTCG